ncbi:hypothetical protein CEXT_802181 [Caerostris extrusa]|uniref:Uncharacterized protein n=1 Tax=Caerostris extrusa TaxID=172846 RepID=A0AAV4NUL4_CAEEX|nr:hypothetical protein CEXT_802181 [Caerostris extrusa]
MPSCKDTHSNKHGSVYRSNFWSQRPDSANFPSLTFPAAINCRNSVRVICGAGHVFGTRMDASFEKNASEIQYKLF